MPPFVRDLVRVVPLVLTLLVAHAALAQPAATEDVRARADAEFTEAKQLMDAGQTSAACAKFARSQQLDPKLGRLLNLAFCHEAEGKTATAWREYNDASALAEQKGQTERFEFAREHAAGVAKKLAFLRIEVPESAAAVEVDGAGLPRDRWSAPLPLDPGEHRVVVSAPGKRARTKVVVVGVTAGIQPLAIGPLDDDGTAPAPIAAPVSAPPAPETEAPRAAPPPDPARDTAPSRVPAYVAGGLAAAGLGIGIAFGVDAAAKKKDADPHCPNKLCDPTGASFVSSARTAATVSTVGFGVFAVGAAAAAWLLLRPAASPAAQAGPRWSPVITTRSAGIGVEGTW